MDASSPREGATHTVADILQIPTQGELSMKTHFIWQGLLDRYWGPQTKDQSSENNLCHSLEAIVNPNKVAGTSNQFPLADLAFQPEVSSWPGHDLFFAYMMSSCVTVLLVGDRWLCTSTPAWCKLIAG